MKLRELLSIGDLKKGKILTKEIGLDNEVAAIPEKRLSG